ncbi:MAG: M48 family metallopeptidase [Sedimentisphaerales bacterium]|nr:M48 family metallopeptidase [Sedimentisphaerales bacterium]
MWELIRINKRNSVLLLVTMACCLIALGVVIGIAVGGPDGGTWGVLIAAAIWVVLTLISFSAGDQILLSASNAVPVTHDVHPQLFNVVEEMSIASGLPMPKVYIINDPAPNAFATGRSPKSACVAVTAGLLGKLNRDELQGVVAHEMSHILHRDILFVTLAGVMWGSVALISQVYLRSMFYGSMGGSRRRYSGGSRGAGGAAAIMLLVAILAAVLAPIMTQLLYFALSRRREYLADAGAARLTRYPEGLANALEKIANDRAPQLATANQVTAPMFIVNPFKKKGEWSLSDLTSTHPPISERIRILRSMSQGASLKDYSEAFVGVTKGRTIMPASALTKEDIALRQASAEAKSERQQQQMRQVGDIMRKVNGFIFLACACGLTLKIPPNYNAEAVKCPRCQRVHNVKRV